MSVRMSITYAPHDRARRICTGSVRPARPAANSASAPSLYVLSAILPALSAAGFASNAKQGSRS